MSDNFDAYYKWLGIPPEEQPPHHYRLLGVRPFEADLDVIDNAADQRMTHVRTFQSGKHAAYSQKILNEISAAKVCLLNVARKAEYDKTLRSKLAAATSASASPPAPPAYRAPAAMPPVSVPQVRFSQPVAQAPVASVDVATPEPSDASDLGQIVNAGTQRRSAARSKQKQTSLLLPVAAILGLVAILAVVVVVVKNRAGSEQLAKQTATAGKAKSKGDHAGDSTASKDTATSSGSGKSEEPVIDSAATQKLLKRLGSSIKAGQIEESDSVGGEGGKVFRDLPPGGAALLSGFDVTLEPADSSDSPAISSIRAAFLTSYRVVTPVRESHGTKEEPVINIRAKAGYAVGAVELLPGDRVAGFRVQFYAITDAGLDPDHSYPSVWYGQPRRGRTVRLGDGRPVIGIAGASSDVVDRLSLILEAGESETAAAEKPKKPKGKVAAPDAGDMTGDTTVTVTSPSEAMRPAAMPPADEPPPRSFPQAPAVNDAPRVAVPDADAQRAARMTVHDLFKDQYAEIANSVGKPTVAAEKKLALARKLFHAAENENDSAARYVLLDEARKLAAQVGDSQGVMDAIFALAARFDIDDVQVTLESLEETNAAPASPGLKRRLVENILMLMSRAVIRERFDAAETLKDLGIKAAKSAGDVLLQKQILWRRDRLNEAHKAYDEAQAALATLKNNANDAAANLTVGRYRSFFQEDWKVGLPLLAKGSDAPLKRLAEQELAPPTDAMLQVKLGDEWLAADRIDDASAPYYQRLARQWYETAMSRLAGVTRLSTQAKLEKMLGGHGLRAEFFNGAGNFEDKVKSRVDAKIDFNWGGAPPEDLPSDQFTVRWSGWLAAPPAKNGQYSIILNHDAGAKLWIDNKPVIDNLAAAGREEKHYQLQSNKPRNIKLEYVSKGGGKAHVSLRWAQQEGFPEQPIPPEALFQERTAAEKGFSPLPVPRPIDNTPLVVYVPDEVPALQVPPPQPPGKPPDPGTKLDF